MNNLKFRVLMVCLITFWAVSLLPVGQVQAISDVGSATYLMATAYGSQRKTFYANGRYWVFYSNGTNMVYKTSVTGLTGSWGDVTAIRSSAQEGTEFSISFNGTYVSYAYLAIGTAGAYYRSGTPNSDGTITWLAPEQTADAFAMGSGVTINVDSDGYPFIGFKFSDKPQVTKSAWNNGSWSTDSGFPYLLNSTVSVEWHVNIVPLTANRMYALYTRNSQLILGRLWNGTAWGGEENATSSNIEANYMQTVVNEGDDVHLVFLKDVSYEVVYVKRTYGSGWGSETVLSIESAITSPSITISGSNLYVFWGYDTSDTMYYKALINGEWRDRITWFTDSITADSITSFYQVWNNKLGVVWTDRPGNTVKFDEPTSLIFHGLYDEGTGSRDYDGVNVTAYFDDVASDTFFLNGTVNYYAISPVLFKFDLGYNMSRVYYVTEDYDEVWLFKPTEPYYTYYFTIVDLVGINNGYLETILNINGTDRILERWSLDIMNQVPFIMSWGRAYTIRLTCDQGTYTWGMFVAGAESSQTLVITPEMFPVSYPGLNVTANALRVNATYLQVNYTDSENLTSWVQITIQYKQGFSWSTAYTQNNTGNTHQLNWYSADEDVDYLARVTALRDDETETWSFSLPKPPLTTNPWDVLDALGTWPFPSQNVIGLGLVLMVFGVFSYYSMPVGSVLGVVTAAFLTLIGWLDMNWNLIALAGAVAIFAGLAKAKKEEREI